MSAAKQLIVVVGSHELDAVSMNRTQMRELTKLRKAAKADLENDEAIEGANEYMEQLLKELYPAIASDFGELPNRELMVLANITEQFSAGLPVDVIEALIKNA